MQHPPAAVPGYRCRPGDRRSVVLAGWAAADMPGQQGRTALVTGANSGIGFQAAVELARHGAVVLMACRDAARGASARDALVRQVPAAAVEVVALDLADLDSV